MFKGSFEITVKQIICLQAFWDNSKTNYMFKDTLGNGKQCFLWPEYKWLKKPS